MRWLGESYCVHLRAINNINEKHVEALKSPASSTMELIEGVHEKANENLSEHICSEMGEYDDGD